MHAMMRLGASLACLVMLTGCGAGPSNLGGTRPGSSSSDASDAAITNFAMPTATSGCPSPECSDILAKVAQGAKTDAVPADLTPTVAASAKDLKFPDGGQCAQLPLPNMKQNWQPCIYPTGAKPDAPLIVVIGDSQAWMWSTPVQKMAAQLGYRAAAVQHAGCHMADITLPTTQGGVSDADCRAWKTAAIDWVNSLNPAVVLVSSAVSRAVKPDAFGKAYVPTIQKLEAPGRKVFVMGNVPRLDQDPPRCLAGHTDTALKCATATATAAPAGEQQAVFDAARQAQAGYVNITPLACTSDVCPAVIGNYAVYQDQFHFSSTYAQALVPVIIKALDLTAA